MAALIPPRPGEFCRHLLNALDASEGRSKRRKRDQTPDTIGLGLKRALLERATEADPDPEAFEAWLIEQVLAEPASGGLRAMCGEVLDDYRFAAADPTFRQWLADGAPSADAGEPMDFIERGPRRQRSEAPA
jgi:hypothetical protein